ncbi:MAG TPA: hypothetical protein V6D08_20750 [Candidatus Obscuribacterales bacterium]
MAVIDPVQAFEESNCYGWHSASWIKTYVTAGDESADTEVLMSLSTHPDLRIRQRVAENPKAPTQALDLLCADPSVEVRCALASNAHISRHVAVRLVNDGDATVRYACAENNLLDEELLLELAEDENPYVAHRAMKTLRNKALNASDSAMPNI